MAVATPPTPLQTSPPPAPPGQALPPTKRSWWQQRSKFQKMLLVVSAAFLALFVIGRLNQASAPSTANSPSASQSSASVAPTTSAAASIAPTPSAKPTAVIPAPAACSGACGDANGYTLTLNNANRNAPSDPYSKPEAGNHLVVVTMTFKNGSSDKQSPDIFCCKVTDSLGVTRSQTFSMAPGCETWQGVELAPGASLGPKNMCFEAGGDPNAPLTLVWSPSFGANDVSIRF